MNDDELLQYVVCPVCKGKLIKADNGAKTAFACEICQKAYPIENEIPMLLPESGQPLGQWLGEE